MVGQPSTPRSDRVVLMGDGSGDSPISPLGPLRHPRYPGVSGLSRELSYRKSLVIFDGYPPRRNALQHLRNGAWARSGTEALKGLPGRGDDCGVSSSYP